MDRPAPNPKGDVAEAHGCDRKAPYGNIVVREYFSVFSSARVNAYALVGLGFVMLVYAWFLTHGTFEFFHRDLGEQFYDYQAQALLQGRVDIDFAGIGDEAYDLNGKHYAYFMPAPALPRMVTNAVIPSRRGYWAITSVFTALVLTQVMILCLWRLLVAQLLLVLEPRRARWIELLIIIVFGFGSTSLFLSSRAFVYHEASAWGACFSIAAIYFVLRWQHGGKTYNAAMACLMLFLGFFSRPTPAIGGLVLIAVVGGSQIIARAFPSLRNRVIATGLISCGKGEWPDKLRCDGVLMAGTVITIVLLFGYYNYLRFGSWTDAVPTRLHRQTTPERLARTGGRMFHFANIPQHVLSDLVSPNISITPHFPWFTFNQPKILRASRLDLNEPVASILASMPVLFFLGIAGLIYAVRLACRSKLAYLVDLALIGASVAVMLTFAGLSERYLHDYLPFLSLSALLGLAWICDPKLRGQSLLRGVVAVLAAWSAMAMFGLTYVYQARMLWNRVPDYRMAQLANIGLSIDNLTSQLLHRPHPAETVAPIFSKVYDVQIPPPETGSRQPIVVLGKDGAADYLLIQDLSSSNFRLAFDHWGFGGPQTGLISIPSCRKVRLHVIFDPNGRVAYAGIEGRATLLFYPIELYGWDAGNTFIGVNPYVGASATKKFAGTIQEVSPASVNRAANGTTNLALGKVVTQSSTGYANSGALLAVDGNTDGVFAKGSVTHTFPTANPWWEVDLGAVASIGSVQVWNRTDCCGQRLSDYWVFISEAPFAGDDTPATLQVPCVWSNHQTSAPAPSMSISAGGIRGRYVRVQLAGSDTLSLAEVQVFGSMAPAVPTRSGCTL